ncbi:Gfo/Idh/MocA family oxidoreductase [Oscillatoria sp. CS-180]|uniref:Gfo/Idh/MocA family protein n=1 Tax=Oscillatoria sp. CS-180 TaxID=3021720 RepID=UPI002330393F|nr:Gfo/Idh/MocA family oxidoreductase [Oscillatoria sp. CS-180]MDB9528796.1 Gfo/Idh/MocA family oxidoreductase [Oscillatoria sp. CS-180]
MATGFDQDQKQPLGIGLIGTGFVAKLRADAFTNDSRSQVVAVTGHSPEKVQTFAQAHAIETVSPNEQALVQRSDVDLVVVCHVNRDHGAAVRKALEAGKSVVVEYPLSLSPKEAGELIELAQQKQVLLHVEHIELLGGLHQAMVEHLPKVGTPHYVRYCTAVPQNPVPEKWTYHTELFGFPLSGALSRIHRLTNLFGAVRWVASQIQYDNAAVPPQNRYFKQCRCVAQLRFQSGLMAEVLYAKGEQTWRSQRWMDVEGDHGALVFEGNQGKLISADGETAIEVGSRRGLFAKDTAYVLDALWEGRPLYVTPNESLYALQVAAAAAESAATGRIVEL